jgi:hypothetical protein
VSFIIYSAELLKMMNVPFTYQKIMRTKLIKSSIDNLEADITRIIGVTSATSIDFLPINAFDAIFTQLNTKDFLF